MISKTKIDKVGKILINPEGYSPDDIVKANEIFDNYRMQHLKPLTELTIKIKAWLVDFSYDYYIAQRLKRRPQIIKKLKRFSNMRLSQLQDIGGCRIIVESNKIVDELLKYIVFKLSKSKSYIIDEKKNKNPVDYRIQGRDDSGYRAVHIIVKARDVKLEIQLRSRIQHYWAESIERTSIIYNRNLKEMDGDYKVIEYFKVLSNIFYEIECNREPTRAQKNMLDKKRDEAEEIIKTSDSYRILHSRIEEKFIRAMKNVEKKKFRKIYNWLLIFDWQNGVFKHWLILEGSDSEKITREYVRWENIYNVEKGFEVVLIGASSVETVQYTHSHYFGLEEYDKILDGIDSTLLSFKKRRHIDAASRRILEKLVSKKKWGRSGVAFDTIKNHYFPKVLGIEEVLDKLTREKLLICEKHQVYSLNTGKADEIHSLI